MSVRLKERRARHLERPKVYRVGVVVAGFLVTLAGVVMLVVPGPAFVVIPIGLGLLALEFSWAERLLAKALDQAEIAQRKAAQASRGQKIASAAAVVVGAIAFIIAARTWDIPLVPWF